MTMTETPLGRSVFLLGEVVWATEPARYGCCAHTEPCHDHAQDQEAADLVGDIRDAVKNAADEDEAGRMIAAVLRGGKPGEITPAQREFAATAMQDAARWLLGADEDESALKAARHAAADRIRDARTVTEIGIAMTGGTK